MARRTSTEDRFRMNRKMIHTRNGKIRDNRSLKEIRADQSLDRQIQIPLYVLLTILVAHALSGTSSFSLPHLSTHLPHSIQTLLPTWARHLPILAPFATELPNASQNSKFTASPHDSYWTTTGYAGPFRSDAVGFGHPLTALHNLTRACLGLSYEVREEKTFNNFGSSFLPDDLHYRQSYFDRYPWNSWLSQADQESNFMNRKYQKGFKDVFFILTGIFVFTVLRALVVRYVLLPAAFYCVPSSKERKSNGAQAADERQKRRMCTRFAEQAWVSLWGIFSLTLSLYVASQEPYWTSELALWSGWPVREMSGLSKFYYLLQTSFWVQQVIVINVEDRRKDYWQMLSHHIVTILLLLGSYVSHFTPIGNVILILMDPCDILLSLAKCLRYAGQQTLCDVFFGLFMIGWIITRHALYNRALYSCIAIARKKLPEYPGATVNDYWGFRTFTALSLVILLCILQVILCVWLVMIIRVAFRVITGQGAADTRSDEESDEEAEILEKEKEINETKRSTNSIQLSSTDSNPSAISSQIKAIHSPSGNRRKG